MFQPPQRIICKELFNIVLPVFCIILTGYLTRHFKVLGQTSAEALNRRLHYHSAIVNADRWHGMLTELLNGPFIAVYVVGNLLTVLLAVILAKTGIRLS
ncbi:MAG: hypothetical protein R3F37_03750 [Candidatus Competibacteraceae bacterium]